MEVATFAAHQSSVRTGLLQLDTVWMGELISPALNIVLRSNYNISPYKVYSDSEMYEQGTFIAK
jgi:hypothetical protein